MAGKGCLKPTDDCLRKQLTYSTQYSIAARRNGSLSKQDVPCQPYMQLSPPASFPPKPSPTPPAWFFRPSARVDPLGSAARSSARGRAAAASCRTRRSAACRGSPALCRGDRCRPNLRRGREREVGGDAGPADRRADRRVEVGKKRYNYAIMKSDSTADGVVNKNKGFLPMIFGVN